MLNKRHRWHPPTSDAGDDRLPSRQELLAYVQALSEDRLRLAKVAAELAVELLEAQR